MRAGTSPTSSILRLGRNSSYRARRPRSVQPKRHATHSCPSPRMAFQPANAVRGDDDSCHRIVVDPISIELDSRAARGLPRPIRIRPLVRRHRLAGAHHLATIRGAWRDNDLPRRIGRSCRSAETKTPVSRGRCTAATATTAVPCGAPAAAGVRAAGAHDDLSRLSFTRPRLSSITPAQGASMHALPRLGTRVGAEQVDFAAAGAGRHDHAFAQAERHLPRREIGHDDHQPTHPPARAVRTQRNPLGWPTTSRLGRRASYCSSRLSLRCFSSSPAATWPALRCHSTAWA